MNIAIFGTGAAEMQAFRECLPEHELHFFHDPLDNAFAAREDASGFEAISVFIHDRVTAAVIAGMPRLRLIVTRSTGFDHIDMTAANAAGITVSNVPNYGQSTVAEFTFALILALSRNLHRAYVHSKQGDFSLDGLQGLDLKGRTIGIIGTGHIGLHVARIADGFWMRVLATDLKPSHAHSAVLNMTYTSLEDLLMQSDVVTLHTPLTPQTNHIINAASIATMKKGAILINTGRGALVDTPAVLEALDSGRLRGAALDVLEEEESLAEIGEAMLRRRPNLILTPHMAFDSQDAVERILETTVGNIRSFAAGHSRNIVSSPALDEGPIVLEEP